MDHKRPENIKIKKFSQKMNLSDYVELARLHSRNSEGTYIELFKNGGVSTSAPLLVEFMKNYHLFPQSSTFVLE